MVSGEEQLAFIQDASTFLDTSVPNTARIFNYLLGGSANFEIDREIAGRMLKIFPSLRKLVRLRHAFVQEAVQELFEGGFNQFLDLGSGLPTTDHIHALIPGARVIYSDINPVAVTYGKGLFADLDNIDYVRGDVRHIEEILESPSVRKLFDLSQPVAIGLNAVTIFLSEQENQALAQALYDWAPPGSQIFVVFQTKEGSDEKYERLLSITGEGGLPIQLYTLEQNIEMMKPWYVSRVEPLVEFLGLPADFITAEDRGNINIFFYAAFLTKQEDGDRKAADSSL